MSEKIISAFNSTATSARFLLVLIVLFFIGVILYGIIEFVLGCITGKIKKEIKAKEDFYEKEIAEKTRKKDEEEQTYLDYSKMREEIKEKQDSDPDIIALRLKLKKYSKFEDNNVPSFFNILGIVCGVYAILALFFMLIYSTGYGGTFGDVHTVNCEENTICVTMYYDIDYAYAEQNTLTVFVKNNSGKDVKSATIKEKNSNTQSTVKNLDNGDEKIVSMVVFGKEGAKYEFEIIDVEYVE